MEFVTVDFPTVRKVLIDDVEQGDNRDDAGRLRILRVNAGQHVFALSGADDYTPASQLLQVKDTTPISPLRVVFKNNPDSHNG